MRTVEITPSSSPEGNASGFTASAVTAAGRLSGTAAGWEATVCGAVVWGVFGWEGFGFVLATTAGRGEDGGVVESSSRKAAENAPRKMPRDRPVPKINQDFIDFNIR